MLQDTGGSCTLTTLYRVVEVAPLPSPVASFVFSLPVLSALFASLPSLTTTSISCCLAWSGLSRTADPPSVIVDVPLTTGIVNKLVPVVSASAGSELEVDIDSWVEADVDGCTSAILASWFRGGAGHGAMGIPVANPSCWALTMRKSRRSGLELRMVVESLSVGPVCTSSSCPEPGMRGCAYTQMLILNVIFDGQSLSQALPPLQRPPPPELPPPSQRVTFTFNGIKQTMIAVYHRDRRMSNSDESNDEGCEGGQLLCVVERRSKNLEAGVVNVPGWMVDLDEKKLKVPGYLFCPAKHRKQIIRLFTKQFCLHLFFPEREKGSMSVEHIRRNSIWEIPFLPRTRSPRSLGIHVDQLVSTKALDPAMEIMLDTFCMGRSKTLTSMQKYFKSGWQKLAMAAISTKTYKTNVLTWTCNCRWQKYHSHHLCKHLVQAVQAPPTTFWQEVQGHWHNTFAVCPALTCAAEIRPNGDSVGDELPAIGLPPTTTTTTTTTTTGMNSTTVIDHNGGINDDKMERQVEGSQEYVDYLLHWLKKTMHYIKQQKTELPPEQSKIYFDNLKHKHFGEDFHELNKRRERKTSVSLLIPGVGSGHVTPGEGRLTLLTTFDKDVIHHGQEMEHCSKTGCMCDTTWVQANAPPRKRQRTANLLGYHPLSLSPVPSLRVLSNALPSSPSHPPSVVDDQLDLDELQPVFMHVFNYFTNTIFSAQQAVANAEQRITQADQCATTIEETLHHFSDFNQQSMAQLQAAIKNTVANTAPPQAMSSCNTLKITPKKFRGSMKNGSLTLWLSATTAILIAQHEAFLAYWEPPIFLHKLHVHCIDLTYNGNINKYVELFRNIELQISQDKMLLETHLFAFYCGLPAPLVVYLHDHKPYTRMSEVYNSSSLNKPAPIDLDNIKNALCNNTASPRCFNCNRHGHIASQWLEHHPQEVEVLGSNPVKKELLDELPWGAQRSRIPNNDEIPEMPWLKRYQAHPLYNNNAYILHNSKSGQLFIISAEVESPDIPSPGVNMHIPPPTLATWNANMPRETYADYIFVANSNNDLDSCVTSANSDTSSETIVDSDSALQWSLKATIDSAKSLTKPKSKLHAFTDKLKAKMKKLVLDCFPDKATKKFIDDGLIDSIIEGSNLPWASNLLPVRKKDNTYPLPRIEDYYVTLQDKRLFTSIDPKFSHWQAPKQAFLIDWISDLESRKLEYDNAWDSLSDSDGIDNGSLDSSLTDSATKDSASGINASNNKLSAAEKYIQAMCNLYATRYLQPHKKIPKTLALLLLGLKDHPSIFRSYVRVTPACFDALVSALKDDPVFYNNSRNEQMPLEHQLAIALYCFGHYSNAASNMKIALMFGVGYGTVNLMTSHVMKADYAPEKEKAKHWVKDTSCPG
ncbi:uncharacterized protein SCHCODRAFT_02673958 [Schizophyllum commune H4-8]|uniref:SWIM-type domain-containing protein n=1 Tax=Schizophyllum commune (strain H4-8 / FGSC 9210) TaxID=578458 RepID=D8QLL7_SCHCM|nr:uncharacterized protein SCHCODRAFT_02673958 [Schizophyllum commune H4-8]KAI5884958.1 hypothetical protein SCHCODRAFT_02673958 [Schizophyllum commune H4-8]